MQPYANPTRWELWKMTSIFLKIEDNLNCFLRKKTSFFENGRQPQFFENRRQPQFF
jgi:hypothetical protein